MKNFRLLLLAVFTALAAGAFVPAGAGAEALFNYHINLSSPDGGFVAGLDTTKKTTIRVMRGLVEQSRNDLAAGDVQRSIGFAVLAGDVIEVYQGASWPANPPAVGELPTETFTVPPLSVTGTAGSPVVSGTAEVGAAVHVRHSWPCNGIDGSIDAVPSSGAFSATFPVPMRIGESLEAKATQPDGDSVVVSSRIPGDANCMNVFAESSTNTNPWSWFNSYNSDLTPYGISAGGLDFGAIPTARLVLRRGGTIIADQNSDGIALTPSQKPQPGDVIELYRPKDAAAPSASWTIPSLGGVFDATSDLTAVDAPAASLIGSNVCRAVDCSGYSSRGQRNTSAGRTIFSFGVPQGQDREVDVLPNDQVNASWTSSDETFTVAFDLVPGDLTAPTGKLTLASKFNLAKLLKKFGYKLNSSEAGTEVANLTSTPNLPAKKRGRKRSAAKTKIVTLASGTSSVIAGDNTLSLKFTSSGKKTIKKMIAARKTQKATLTVTLTDAAGNASTVVKDTKLVVKKSRKK